MPETGVTEMNLPDGTESGKYHHDTNSFHSGPNYVL